MSLMPVGEEVTMVTWEELEQAITDGWRASQGVNKLGTWALVSGGAPRTSPSLLLHSSPLRGCS